MAIKKTDKVPSNTEIKGEKRQPVRDDKGRWVKGTPPPNPKGRPADGESWSAIIKEISEMTVDEIVILVGKDNDLGRQFALMPKKIMMKKLVVARVLAALMFEPSAGLWNSLMERAEGKIQDNVDITSGGEKILDDKQIDRAISTLADAIGKVVSGESSK